MELARRIQRSVLQPDLGLLLGCAVIGSVTDLIAGAEPLSAAPRLLGFSVLELVPVLVLVRLSRRWTEAGRPASLRWLVLGTGLAATLGAGVTISRLPFERGAVLNSWIGMVLPCALFLGASELRARALRAEARTHALSEATARAEAELQAARARLLEAQIEPHFLFNTLANVRQLQRTDPVTGLEMLSDLIEYLERSLPGLRTESATLEEERALVAAYLRLHRPRFGSRLEFDIAFPDRLLGCEVPSMMLLTLVENSLKHGLGPLPEGGAIQLSAEAAGAALVLTVTDTGAGMIGGSGGGTGLANIRSRLALRYGDSAGLTLSLNEPRGFRASLRLPLESSPA